MPKGNDGVLRRHRVRSLLACLLALAAVATAGCGDSGDSDSGSASTVASRARRVVQVERVKQDRWTYARARFNEICAGCHTLADSGATGRRFNLDRGQGINETHVRATIAFGEPGMPAFHDVLSPREFEEIVAYLVAVAGRRIGGDDYWSRQLALRGEGAVWSRADTERLEDFARRLVREKSRQE